MTDFDEEPWHRFIRALEKRGDLLTIDGVLIDAGALFRTRFRCDTRTCAEVNRPDKTDSCCRDYEVEITASERDRIAAHATDVIGFLATHDASRVTPDRTIDSFFLSAYSIQLAKEDNRCAFSYRDSNGRLWCGIHSMALEKNLPVESIKPYACILFPLVVRRLEDGTILLTAASSETEALYGGKDSALLPCLREPGGEPMYRECRRGIELGFGTEFYARMDSAAVEFKTRR
jgi:hypothetical protein